MEWGREGWEDHQHEEQEGPEELRELADDGHRVDVLLVGAREVYSIDKHTTASTGVPRS